MWRNPIICLLSLYSIIWNYYYATDACIWLYLYHLCQKTSWMTEIVFTILKIQMAFSSSWCFWSDFVQNETWYVLSCSTKLFHTLSGGMDGKKLNTLVASIYIIRIFIYHSALISFAIVCILCYKVLSWLFWLTFVLPFVLGWEWEQDGEWVCSWVQHWFW